jgi:hypothetical protein
LSLDDLPMLNAIRYVLTHLRKESSFKENTHTHKSEMLVEHGPFGYGWRR